MQKAYYCSEKLSSGAHMIDMVKHSFYMPDINEYNDMRPVARVVMMTDKSTGAYTLYNYRIIDVPSSEFDPDYGYPDMECIEFEYLNDDLDTAFEMCGLCEYLNNVSDDGCILLIFYYDLITGYNIHPETGELIWLEYQNETNLINP